MTIEYTSSRRDIASWYWRSLLRNRRHLRAWLAIVFLVAVWVFLLVPEGNPPSLLRRLGWSVGAIVLVTVLLALFPQLQFKPQKRTFTVESNGMSTTINGRSKNYRWSEVASIADERGYVVITLVNVNAFVIPPHAFSSPEQRLTFLRETRDWHATGVAPSAA